MQKLNTVFFYTLEKAIRSYRQFAQKKINDAGIDITVDQCLVLKALLENDGISQQQIAQLVFKDVASVTRIIELLVGKNYLSREMHTGDRRRFSLTVTEKGKEVVATLEPHTLQYRNQALKGLTDADIDSVQKALLQIIANVS